jgi:hypothetical protein
MSASLDLEPTSKSKVMGGLVSQVLQKSSQTRVCQAPENLSRSSLRVSSKNNSLRP